MVGWHHPLDGHEFEQALGDSEGQRRLACCSSWGCKELDTTEQLNNKNQNKARYKLPAGDRNVKFKDDNAKTGRANLSFAFVSSIKGNQRAYTRKSRTNMVGKPKLREMMLMIPLYANNNNKKRHRCIEQSFRLCGRRRGWDVSREQHRNMYII